MATNNAVNVGLSGSTGTGNFVGSTSPTLVTPALGTPASGTLTNCTGYTQANITGAAFTDWSGTLGFTGFSANPTAIVARYSVVGKICFIYIGMTVGTSNSTSFTITNLPFTSAGRIQYVDVAEGYDNSAITTVPCSALISASSTTLTMRKDGVSAGWTASGSKGALFEFWYETA